MAPTIIHSVLLFDGNTVHRDATVSFDPSTGLITSVSNDKSSFPDGANVIDGTGHTLLPGLIESHMHVHNLHLPPGSDEADILRSPLRSGVTTVCDMHSGFDSVDKWRRRIADELEQARGGSGTVSLSDLKSSLYGATVAGGWPVPIVLGPNPSEELKAHVSTWPAVTESNAVDFVKEHKEQGANYIKLMQENCCSLALPTGSIPEASLELQTAVVKAAHDVGFPVVGHATSVHATEIILKSGADGLTHTFVDQAPPESIIDLYKKTNAFVIPTLTVLSSLTGDDQERRERFADIAFKKGAIDENAKQNMTEFLGMKAPEAQIDYAYQTVTRLKKEGIDVLAGTDSVSGLKGTAIGPSLWHELELYVEKCGFGITDALNAATALPAKRFGFTDRGVVAEGKRADLILVKGNVTEKLQDLWEGEGIVSVWKVGFKAT